MATGYIKRRFFEVEEELLPFGFFKIHRSILINLDKIASLHPIDQSRYEVRFHGIKESVYTSKEGAKQLRGFLER